MKLWPLVENKEDVVEKSNPNSNRFLTSCFLTLARPKKKEDERSRGGGRAKEALCLEVSSACPPGNYDICTGCFFDWPTPFSVAKGKFILANRSRLYME